MYCLNKVMLIGRLGADPETRIPKTNFTVTTFSIATNEQWNDKETGEKQEKTGWHRIVAFNKLAEICSEYLKKGKQVYIEGRLQTRSYEKDDQTVYITEIIADDMLMLGPKDVPEKEPPSTKKKGGTKKG